MSSLGATTNGEGTDVAARMRDVSLWLGGNRILSDVSFDIDAGRYVALVGESGSGKSTIGRVLVGRFRPSAGEISVAGIDVSRLQRQSRASLYRRVQLIPQDPYSSLDPRRTIGQTLAEAVDPRNADFPKCEPVISEMMEALRLERAMLMRFPHEFSGGQRQRIAIARALLVRPQLVIADEITSALDVSVQADVVSILQAMRGAISTMLFITHNLALARELCDDVVVLRNGCIVETGAIESVYRDPQNAYTRQLLASIPGQVPRIDESLSVT